jgi:hypothetical protein
MSKGWFPIDLFHVFGKDAFISQQPQINGCEKKGVSLVVNVKYS